ncbi:MAG: GntR family transcriptional regulator [Clostridia bacterium]|nr:GntR family transcriptional regulator [Clostridia bacterium]
MNYAELASAVGPRVGATQEWVFNILREGIVSGKLPGGMQLKQDEISTALNVSHIPVREALRQLEAQGLVRIHPNRGASVTKLSRATLEDMMDVRASIASSVLTSAIPKMTAADFERMREIIELQKHAADLFTSEKLNYEFHDLLLKPAENSIATLLMEIIHANIDRYLRKSFYGEDSSRSFSIAEHEQIVEACEKGESELAAKLLSRHILGAKARIPAELA